MDNESRECEGVRKESVVDLVTVDITTLPSDTDEEKRTLIKKVSPWTEVFSKTYDNLVVKVVAEHASQKKVLVLQGVRMETEDEFRHRMGLSDESSWTIRYIDLTKSSKAEAKAEMMKMLKKNLVTTPENWIQYKQSMVEEFLNMRSDEDNKKDE